MSEIVVDKEQTIIRLVRGTDVIVFDGNLNIIRREGKGYIPFKQPDSTIIVERTTHDSSHHRIR